MTEQDQKSILRICLMAAFADGAKHERERDEIRRIANSLAGDASINLSGPLQDVLLKRVSLADAAAGLSTSETRQLAFEMAVCVCDADGAQSDVERAFLAELGTTLGLDAGKADAYVRQAETLANAPITVAPKASSPTLSNEDMEKTILNAAILNGALELLPESLASMAIIPLQIRLVYRIGKSYGFEADRGHIKDFIATLGAGLTSQYLEQIGRKLIGGLLGGLGRQAVSSGMSFASTYALGHIARRYYAGGRQLSKQMLKEAFDDMLGQARQLQARYLPEMQAKARTLNTAQVIEMVRQG